MSNRKRNTQSKVPGFNELRTATAIILGVLVAGIAQLGPISTLQSAQAAPSATTSNGGTPFKVPVTSFKDVTGNFRHLPEKGAKATVLIFIAHDCPISNAYAQEFNRIATEYGSRGVKLMMVYAESEVTVPQVREHARQYGYKVPIVLDAQHKLSRAVGATVTPQASVLSADGTRVYLGRIDNRYVGYGKTRTQTTQRDLRAALDAVLAGKPVANAVTTAIGCFIPE